MIVPDKIIRSSRRSLSLVIDKEGRLIVHAPRRMSIDDINAFIKEKSSWISKKQNSIRNINNDNQKLLSYDEIQLLGKKYRVIPIQGIKEVMLGEKDIVIPYQNSPKDRAKYLAEYIKSQTHIIIDSRVEYFANIMQIEYNSVKLTNARTKWGSCTKDGDLRFNTRLSMLSPTDIDYIIIHELCHIIEFNHSKKFYSLIAVLMPNYKKSIKSVRGQGYLLNMF